MKLSRPHTHCVRIVCVCRCFVRPYSRLWWFWRDTRVLYAGAWADLACLLSTMWSLSVVQWWAVWPSYPACLPAPPLATHSVHQPFAHHQLTVTEDWLFTAQRLLNQWVSVSNAFCCQSVQTAEITRLITSLHHVLTTGHVCRSQTVINWHYTAGRDGSVQTRRRQYCRPLRDRVVARPRVTVSVITRLTIMKQILRLNMSSSH